MRKRGRRSAVKRWENTTRAFFYFFFFCCCCCCCCIAVLSMLQFYFTRYRTIFLLCFDSMDIVVMIFFFSPLNRVRCNQTITFKCTHTTINDYQSMFEFKKKNAHKTQTQANIEKCYTALNIEIGYLIVWLVLFSLCFSSFSFFFSV